MTEPVLSCLLRQHDTAWKLACHHLDGLTTEACLWQPGGHGPHVHPRDDGRWLADWPTRESYARAMTAHAGPSGTDRLPT